MSGAASSVLFTIEWSPAIAGVFAIASSENAVHLLALQSTAADESSTGGAGAEADGSSVRLQAHKGRSNRRSFLYDYSLIQIHFMS